jgi:hypothetical protein
LRSGLASQTPAEQYQTLLALVHTHALTVLGHPASHRLDPDQAFQLLGFDSLTAVELRNSLTTAIGHRLPAAAIFDHPTLTALARYLREQLLPSGNGHSVLSENDEEIRRILVSIPIATLRAANLVDTLKQLAATSAVTVDSEHDQEDTIQNASVDDLVRLALSGNES